MAAAKKTPSTPKDSRPAGRALEWGDLSAGNQRKAEASANATGRGAKRTATAFRNSRAAVAADETKDAPARRKAGADAEKMNKILPDVKSLPMRVDDAAGRHAQMYRAAQDKADGQIPRGAGWYFEHHRDIADGAAKHGFSNESAMTASAVMSPSNAPENEKKATHALMHGLSSGTVMLDERTSAHLAKSGIPVRPEQVGTRAAYADLHPKTMAALSTASVHPHVDTDINLSDVSLGGMKSNINKAVDVLNGSMAPGEAIDASTAPKTHTYARNTVMAQPDTAEHSEFMHRVAHTSKVAAGVVHPDQGHMDVFGMAGARHGMLNPDQASVQDTWQNGISGGQVNEVRGRANVMKSMGTIGPMDSGINTGNLHTDTSITAKGVQHAFNGEATRRATAQVSAPGTPMSPVAVQSVGWTHARIVGGKDPAYNASPEGAAARQKVADAANPIEAGRRTEAASMPKGQMSMDIPRAKYEQVRPSAYEAVQASSALDGSRRARR